MNRKITKKKATTKKKTIQQLGGEAVKKKYPNHFKRMNEIRWGKVKKSKAKKKK